METKKCSKCGEVKGVEEFAKSKLVKSVLQSVCRKCNDKEYRLKNKEHIKEYEKEYYLKNKERIKERTNKYYHKNAEHYREYAMGCRIRNQKRKKEYYLKNKEKRKQYYHKNAEHYREYDKEYYLKNKEKRKQYYRENAEHIKKTKIRINETAYDINTCPEELKPIIEALILIKNKKSYIRKEIQNESGKRNI
jgi:hypothetical protein